MARLETIRNRLLREKEWLLNHLEAWFDPEHKKTPSHEQRARELMEIEKSLAQLDPVPYERDPALSKD